MKKILAFLVTVLLCACPEFSYAQFTGGTVLTAAQLNSALAAKVASSSLSASSGAGLVGFLQNGTGAVSRTVASRLQDTVNVKDFGAACNGTTDDSTAIQAALNSGASGVFVPQGTCVAANLTMPSTAGFVLYGAGSGSVLKQAGGVNPLIKWNQASIFYQQGYIRDLAFDGTNGANNTIDTTGVGGETLQNLYFNNTPTGYSSIYVNGAASTYTHDMRLMNIQVYSNLAGTAGVRFGPLTSDASLDGFIMNGNFAVQYGLYYDIGAQTIRVSNSHPYNAATNIAFLAGSNNQMAFNNVVFDNAHQDLVKASNSSNVTFSNCYFESIPSGYYGANLNSTAGFSFYNNIYAGSSGALAAVKDDAGSSYTVVNGGSFPVVGNFTAPFSLSGTNSYALGLAGYNPLGTRTYFVGATTSAQAQNTTVSLGANGAQASANNTAWVAPNAGILTTAYVAVDSTPASGQTFTFNVKSGSTTLGTITINNGSFSGSLVLNSFVSQYSQISIQSVFSAASGSANVRYALGFTQ